MLVIDWKRMAASPPSCHSETSFVPFLTNCWHTAIWFLALTQFPSTWVMSLDETSFRFQRVHLCSITGIHHPIPNVCMNVCVHILYVWVHCYRWSKHSHLDSYSRPNFSIHWRKRKVTPSLCLSSATVTRLFHSNT